MALFNATNTPALQDEPLAERAATATASAASADTAAAPAEYIPASTGTSVAEYHRNDVVAATPQASFALPNYDDAGFEGVEVGSRTFPIIALKNDGVFEDTEGRPWGKGFQCRVLSTKRKFVISGKLSDKDIETMFSPDKAVDTKGRECVKVLKEWEARGRQISEWREYRDVVAEVVMPGDERDGELVVLSVSPQSVSRLNKKLIRLTMGVPPQALKDHVAAHILTVSVGVKVTKAIQPFYPWDFSFSKEAAQASGTQAA